jgi:hypothetical protein
MDLMHPEEMGGCNPHLLRHAAAIFRDIGRVVIGAEAAVEAGIDAAGHAALAREEGVPQARNG